MGSTSPPENRKGVGVDGEANLQNTHLLVGEQLEIGIFIKVSALD
jgi:hypothetical protein